MKVYVVFCSDFDGRYVHGIYTTPEVAHQAVIDAEEKDEEMWYTYYFREFEVYDELR